ncbi:hypothetical protein O181_104522 [Austropuccinia psidii MF-1]|uniref:Uncharacterized protein n=1 Tax=Austropuccinia psidii MF-1 TaxID=1389203 RepID=A0A9Q3JLV4_9BASI|nr:hypothetical protein [Austropuccinia psidii MF-1]
MLSNRLGASFNPSSTSMKAYRGDYGRIHSVTKGQGSVNATKTDKLFHSEADNTVFPSKRAGKTTRSLSGHLKIQPEGLKKFLAAQSVPDPCRSVKN